MLQRSPDLLLSSYDFALPASSIAQVPAERRDGSRLLVARRDGAGHEGRAFTDLTSLLSPGDLLVVNDTKVLPARLTARRDTGGAVRLLALAPQADGWRCMVKPSAKVKPGESITLVDRATDEAGPRIVVGEVLDGGARLVRAEDGDLPSLMERWGEMPLPPYIERAAPDAADRERYQTLFAAHEGAVAAPTAGLHFTPDILAALAARDISHACVTLHVGAGTFAPVRVEELDRHAMHTEPYAVPPATAEAIAATEARGGRIVCVGTTSARSLESWHRAGRPTDGALRPTDLFLHPGDPPTLDFALLTNFHLPKSTLVVLVASILGRERTLALYRHAVDAGYRFFSYGDACLFL